jgi:type IV secretory pathway VirJ component
MTHALTWHARVLAVALLACATTAGAQSTDTLVIRGHAQSLRLYGVRGGTPVIVSSGDGGWIHLGPHVAEVLAARGYFVVGFDVKAYLSSFTSGTSTLRLEDEPGDYKALVEFAARGNRQRPILVGASEGAGLSVLAATDPATKATIAGVVCLGLPDINELGWRWRDAVRQVDHGVPNEPTFSTASLVGRVAPVPLAAIHSTHDAFVALTDVQRILSVAQEPKRLWIVNASDHGFSSNLVEFDRRLVEAFEWIAQHTGR